MDNPTDVIIGLVVLYVFPALCLFKIAKKTNEMNTWMAWVPGLHYVLILNIANKPPWSIFLLCVPVVNIYVIATAWIEIAKLFNEPSSMGVGAVLPIINIFPLYIFAFRSNLPSSARL